MFLHAINLAEHHPQSPAFYKVIGFEVGGRSVLDGMGKPYPLLHMRLAGR